MAKSTDFTEFNTRTDRTDSPRYERRIQPHRSLSRDGFSWVIALVAFGFSLPMIAVMGTFALWGLFPFILVTLLALYGFIMRNYRDAELSEHIRIWPDLIAVHRHNPRKSDQCWFANPYWVDLKMEDTRALENYITLRGSDRTIELGAFLSPDERRDLFHDLKRALAQQTA